MKAQKAATTLERKLREMSRPALVKRVMRLTEDLRGERATRRIAARDAETMARWQEFEILCTLIVTRLGLAESIRVLTIEGGRAVISDGKDRLVFNREDEAEDDRDFVLMDDVRKWLDKKGGLITDALPRPGEARLPR